MNRRKHRPYAEDWQQVTEELQYSPSKDLYWYKDRVYDHLSATHNGLVGTGAALRAIIKGSRNDAQT